jgi:hypothetical protein
MADDAEPSGHEDVPAFREFVAEARRIRFPVRRCRAGRRLAPDARAAELCTEDQPCAFHSILAMALFRSFSAGRSGAETSKASESPRMDPVPAVPVSTPLAASRPATFDAEPARDLVLEEVAGLALAGNVRA